MNRSQVETILIRRVGGLLSAADLDGTTTGGNNPDLNDPIGFALRQIGIVPLDPTAITDSDVAQTESSSFDRVFDVAELRALETIQGNLALVSITVGARSEAFSDLAQRVEAAITRKRAQILQDYGSVLGLGIEVGNVGLDIMQQLPTAGTE
jgi:hypothetical protein